MWNHAGTAWLGRSRRRVDAIAAGRCCRGNSLWGIKPVGGERTGVSGIAASLTGAAGDAAPAADGQPDLFASDQVGYEAALPSLERTGPGRRPGSLNKKTLAVKAMFAAKGYRDPLLFLGEMYSADPVALRGLLNLHEGEAKSSLLEVLQFQRACAAEVAPYIHGKMPMRIDISDERLPMLHIHLDGDQLTASRRERDAALSIGAPLEQNQALSDVEDGASHDGTSHD